MVKDSQGRRPQFRPLTLTTLHYRRTMLDLREELHTQLLRRLASANESSLACSVERLVRLVNVGGGGCCPHMPNSNYPEQSNNWYCLHSTPQCASEGETLCPSPKRPPKIERTKLDQVESEAQCLSVSSDSKEVGQLAGNESSAATDPPSLSRTRTSTTTGELEGGICTVPAPSEADYTPAIRACPSWKTTLEELLRERNAENKVRCASLSADELIGLHSNGRKKKGGDAKEQHSKPPLGYRRTRESSRGHKAVTIRLQVLGENEEEGEESASEISSKECTSPDGSIACPLCGSGMLIPEQSGSYSSLLSEFETCTNSTNSTDVQEHWPMEETALEMERHASLDGAVGNLEGDEAEGDAGADREQKLQDTCAMLCTLRDRVRTMQGALDSFVVQSLERPSDPSGRV